VSDFEDFSSSVEGYREICRRINVVMGMNNEAYETPGSGLRPD